MRVGFVGLGNMGWPMAVNVLRAGHEVIAFNRTRARAEELAREGARVADSPAAAAREADVVVTMLADDAAVEAAVFGEQGILAGLRPDAVHACMSTIGSELSRRLADAHARARQRYVAAPVFGRPEAASAGKLWVVAAGEAEALEQCRPVFEAVGQGTHVIGAEPPMANIVKITGNFLIASAIEALGEAFALLRKNDVDLTRFLEVVNGSLFKSPLYQNYGLMAARRQYSPAGFRLRLGFKDARLALAEAEAAGAPMPLASLVHDRFLEAVARGDAELDWVALTKVAAEAAGL